MMSDWYERSMKALWEVGKWGRGGRDVIGKSQYDVLPRQRAGMTQTIFIIKYDMAGFYRDGTNTADGVHSYLNASIGSN